MAVSNRNSRSFADWRNGISITQKSSQTGGLCPNVSEEIISFDPHRQSYSDSEVSGPSQIGGCCNVGHPPIYLRSQGDQPSRQSHSGPQAGAGNYWDLSTKIIHQIITIKNHKTTQPVHKSSSIR